jgi:hypothetical protein
MNAEMQPVAREFPIGIAVAGARHEADSIGHISRPTAVAAPAGRLPHWKAETIARAADVILVAAGSIWIMTDLNENMMPPAELINLHMKR